MIPMAAERRRGNFGSSALAGSTAPSLRGRAARTGWPGPPDAPSAWPPSVASAAVVADSACAAVVGVVSWAAVVAVCDSSPSDPDVSVVARVRRVGA